MRIGHDRINSTHHSATIFTCPVVLIMLLVIINNSFNFTPFQLRKQHISRIVQYMQASACMTDTYFLTKDFKMLHHGMSVKPIIIKQNRKMFEYITIYRQLLFEIVFNDVIHFLTGRNYSFDRNSKLGFSVHGSLLLQKQFYRNM